MSNDYVPTMEGADHIRAPEETELWRETGVRVIGPAWDDTRYCDGAWRGSKRGLSPDGRALLDVMADLGLILDLTHMSEMAALQALDAYAGPVVATHANARALVPTERQLSDKQIRLIGERDGVIGWNTRCRQSWERRRQASCCETLPSTASRVAKLSSVSRKARRA